MPALLQLAELDSRRLPDGRLLVAEMDGEILAALAPASGAVVADPFVPTAELQQLLWLRAEQMRANGPTRHVDRHGWHGVLHALAPRRAL